MLSALYSHTQTRTLHRNQSTGSNDEAGDFDNTPAPSTRSSLSLVRPLVETRSKTPNAVILRQVQGPNEALKDEFTITVAPNADNPSKPWTSPQERMHRILIPLRKSSTNQAGRIVRDNIETDGPFQPVNLDGSEQGGEPQGKFRESRDTTPSSFLPQVLF